MGSAGTARASAAVSYNATFDAARSVGIDHVADFGVGFYCVFLVPASAVTRVAPLVSLRGASGSKDTAIYVSGAGCLSGTTPGILVVTQDLSGNAKPADFYLAIP